jgi:hypothetical protein
MRRLFAALIIATATLSVVACGGGGAAEEQNAVAPTPAAAAPVAVAGPTDEDRSPVEVAQNEPFPTSPAESIPDAVLTKLQNKQPMLIYYYDSTMLVTNDQRDEIDAALKQYRGLIDLVAWDEAKAAKSNDTTMNPELAKAMEMSDLIGVKHAPYMLFVDRAGRITGRFAGFTDRNLLEREILRATD